jgi:hypothetical protein
MRNGACVMSGVRRDINDIFVILVFYESTLAVYRQAGRYKNGPVNIRRCSENTQECLK